MEGHKEGEALDVGVNGRYIVPMLIDSGATCNTLGENAARRMHLELKPQKRTIKPYLSPPVICKYVAEAELEVRGQTVQASLVIAPGDAPALLGRDTATELGVLSIVRQLSTPVDVKKHILSKYPGIADGIGKLKDFEVTLHIDPEVTPSACKHNRVPFHLRLKVEQEIYRLLREDIIEEVTGPTEWVSSIVTPPKPKNPQEIRICVDMRKANQAIMRTRHVTPTLDDIIADLSGATVFSKIDLRSGYHQLVLDEKSRGITTFSTHLGLFRYKRLIMGVNSAAEVFQHTIQSVLGGCRGARNISDDVIVYGREDDDHDRALHDALTKIHQAGLTINLDKCEFRKPQIEFFGHIFGPNGLSPDPQKVTDLQEAPQPQNSGEVRSFLGMAQYSARFIPDYATKTAPLRELTKKDTPWEFTDHHARAFKEVKDALSATATNAYFDPQKQTVIYVDASPVGLAAVLTQGDRPVAYASRALTSVEQRYSQTEREALAVTWACEHFSLFVLGSRFTVITDHLPLVGIFRKTDLRQLRLARWALRLSTYDVEIKCRPGKDNPADYLSRHPGAAQPVLNEEKMAEE